MRERMRERRGGNVKIKGHGGKEGGENEGGREKRKEKGGRKYKWK